MKRRKGPTPYEERDAAWYEAAAARTNRNKIRRVEMHAPLFAAKPELLETFVTPDDRRRMDAAIEADPGLAPLKAMHAASAEDRRLYVASKVGPEVLAELDAYVVARSSGIRGRYLADPTYLADHWLQIQRRVDAGLPPIETAEERLTTSRRMIALGQVSG